MEIKKIIEIITIHRIYQKSNLFILLKYTEFINIWNKSMKFINIY